MPQRPINKKEIASAHEIVNWQFWYAPILCSFIALLAAVCLILFGVAGIVALALSSALAGYLWLSRLALSRSLAQDLKAGLVDVYEGPMEKVGINRWSGSGYAIADGKRVRIPNEQYKELKEAMNAAIAYLPGSAIAVTVIPFSAPKPESAAR